MEGGSVTDNGDVLTVSQHDPPVDLIAELESIVHELRAFVAGENRHVNMNGCLTVHCKNEEIEDAVYALGIVFDLEYLFPRGGLCVKFALRPDTPTIIIDDDKLRGIICGDLLNTPTRAMAKKLRLWTLDPSSSTSVRVSHVEKVHQLADLFRLTLWQPEGATTAILTKSGKFCVGQVIDEKRLELVLEQRCDTRTRKTKKGLKRLLKNASVKSLIRTLRQLTADADGPRSMTIPCNRFSPEAAKLAEAFSLTATPESDWVVLTKKSQGPVVVRKTHLVNALTQNTKRKREEEEDVEVSLDSPRASNEIAGSNVTQGVGETPENGLSGTEQLIFEEISDLQQFYDISLLEKRLQEFVDNPRRKRLTIPPATDPKLAALVRSLQLKLVYQEDRITVMKTKSKKKKSTKGKQVSSRKKAKVSASSGIPEEFPEVDPSVLRLWLKTFADDNHAPVEMIIPPTSEKTQGTLRQMAAAFGLDCTSNEGFVLVRKAGRAVPEEEMKELV